MNKCKRNIVLIFGYFLAVSILFVPYVKEAYSLQGIPKELPPLPPDAILGDVKGAYKITKKSLNIKGFKFLPLYFSDVINHKKFIEWKELTEKEGNKIRENREIITSEELFYLETEFLKKYKGGFNYDNFNENFFITEIAIILLAAGFSYILFCVLLKENMNKEGIKNILKISLVVLLLGLFFIIFFNFGANRTTLFPLQKKSPSKIDIQIYSSVISGLFFVLAALITIYFGAKSVANQIKIQKKYDKLVEFQEMASSIALMMLSEANKIIRNEKDFVYDFNTPELKKEDRQNELRTFWDVHAIYEPLIPDDLWDAYSNLGVAYKTLVEIPDFENAHKVKRYYNRFAEKIKEKLK